ncbi:hypothetical protein UFOVP821_31 [uncultured Caudovirales phage]|uniref:Uncharacterized protein n=1 Tax=uncultured Caudovirales phage TaxID=2100421 RepID=A0A6J5P866_9CAUD|nr:hypothetical protein UFOVP821_31 [uncultured Caudovirales phage]
MIIDAQNQFSAAQAVTSTAVSTNVIDLSQAREVFAGEEVEIAFSVDVAATAAGAATVQFQVITSTAPAMSSPTIVVQTDAIPKTSLTQYARFSLCVPSAFINNLGQRYLAIQYTVATGPLTAGSFTAVVVADWNDVPKYYTSGYAVL